AQAQQVLESLLPDPQQLQHLAPDGFVLVGHLERQIAQGAAANTSTFRPTLPHVRLHLTDQELQSLRGGYSALTRIALPLANALAVAIDGREDELLFAREEVVE